MSAHTPGPWRVIGTWNDARDCVPVLAEGVTVAVAFYVGGTDQAKANARLIAAAPEMLEALKDAKHGAEYPDELGGIIDAAIARAEGRS